MKEENQILRNRSCRICKKNSFLKILDLGKSPLANNFYKKSELARRDFSFPLRVYLCRNCALLQLRDIVNPELLFGEYPYITSGAQPLVEHFLELAKQVKKLYIKKRSDLVVDIGSNDGTLLAPLRRACRVLGIDPALNIACIARGRGVETIAKFFNKDLAQKIRRNYGPAKVVTANNIVAHVNNLHDFMEGVDILLAEDGVFIFEVHWVGNLIGEGGFDQIYHEHVSYFSLHSLLKLMDSFSSLNIFDATFIPIHGQSLRVYVGRNKRLQASLEEIMFREKKLGLTTKSPYLKLAKKVKNTKKILPPFLFGLKNEGKKIVGYGAAAKGNTLLNYCGIGRETIDYIVDDARTKQGHFTPGGHIPVYSPQKLKKDVPDYIILLAWNYADAILKKENALRKKGIKFIIPVPRIKIV